MDIVAWLAWALVALLGVLWSVAWFLIAGWVSTLLQIALLIATVYFFKYGWQRAPAGDRRANAELVEASEPIRYQLLKANCDTAEAELVLQPWLVIDQPDLLASDLCRAWIGALQDLGLTHLSERLDDLAAGRPPLPSDQVLFNVKRQSEPKA